VRQLAQYECSERNAWTIARSMRALSVEMCTPSVKRIAPGRGRPRGRRMRPPASTFDTLELLRRLGLWRSMLAAKTRIGAL
jgi:hypothetical protein